MSETARHGRVGSRGHRRYGLSSHPGNQPAQYSYFIETHVPSLVNSQSSMGYLEGDAREAVAGAAGSPLPHFKFQFGGPPIEQDTDMALYEPSFPTDAPALMEDLEMADVFPTEENHGNAHMLTMPSDHGNIGGVEHKNIKRWSQPAYIHPTEDAAPSPWRSMAGGMVGLRENKIEKLKRSGQKERVSASRRSTTPDFSSLDTRVLPTMAPGYAPRPVVYYPGSYNHLNSW